MLERIERVVNNHQLSCQHTKRYFYVLRGFKDFIADIDFPVKHVSQRMDERSNYYILEEELANDDASLFDGFQIIEVNFNLFEDNMILNEGHYQKPKPLDLNIHDTLYIFHQINQLKDVSDEVLNNDERLALIKHMLHEKR